MGFRKPRSYDTADAMASSMFGFAVPSSTNTHTAPKQSWWKDDRIEKTVTEEFVISKLRPEETARLNTPLSFADGLTDDTYMEWILQRGKRFFLILTAIGVPDQIFGVIDDSWDDDELPVAWEDVDKLQLSREKDEELNRKFYRTQFNFLLRELHKGSHYSYAPNEVVPLELVPTAAPTAALQNWTRVHLPGKPNRSFVRRGIQLSENEAGEKLEDDFTLDVASAQYIEHSHIAPIWASYTLNGTGYFLSPFKAEHTLTSFLDQKGPPQFASLAKPKRRSVLLEWLHCLADAIADLHRNGFCHTAIRPSNIVIDGSNKIAFSDIGSLPTLQRGKKVDRVEVYNFAAPEAETAASPAFPDDISSRSSSRGRASILSKSSSERSFSSSEASSGRSKRLAAALPFARRGRDANDPNTPNTEKADVFSLGCVYLEVINFLCKKKSSEFARHRASKTKDSKKGALDLSFHANHDSVFSWMDKLENIAFDCDDNLFRGIPHLLTLIRSMLANAPELRPTADTVRDRVYDILISYSNMQQLCCGGKQHPSTVVSSKTVDDIADTTSSKNSSWESSNSADGSIMNLSGYYRAGDKDGYRPSSPTASMITTNTSYTAWSANAMTTAPGPYGQIGTGKRGNADNPYMWNRRVVNGKVVITMG